MPDSQHHPDMRAIGVVGGGQMGSGIAEVCARAGRDVTVVETSPEAAGAAKTRIRKSLDRAVRHGRLAEDDRAEVEEHLRSAPPSVTSPTASCSSSRPSSRTQVKTTIFDELDRVVKSPDALLASNTSSIPHRARHRGRDCGLDVPGVPRPRVSAPPLLARMIDAGMLGRKTGHGFYPDN